MAIATANINEEDRPWNAEPIFRQRNRNCLSACKQLAQTLTRGSRANKRCSNVTRGRVLWTDCNPEQKNKQKSTTTTHSFFHAVLSCCELSGTLLRCWNRCTPPAILHECRFSTPTRALRRATTLSTMLPAKLAFPPRGHPRASCK